VIDTLTNKSFLIRANCVAAVTFGTLAVAFSPWLFIPGVANLAAATLLLRNKK